MNVSSIVFLYEGATIFRFFAFSSFFYHTDAENVEFLFSISIFPFFSNVYIYLFFSVLFCRLLYVVRIVQYFCILLHAMCIWPLTDFASVNITIYLYITYIYGLNVKYLFYIPISLKILLSLFRPVLCIV